MPRGIADSRVAAVEGGVGGGEVLEAVGLEDFGGELLVDLVEDAFEGCEAAAEGARLEDEVDLGDREAAGFALDSYFVFAYC